MTIATDRGFVVGKTYTFVNQLDDEHGYFSSGDVLKLVKDDGDDCPFFERNDGMRAFVDLDRFASNKERTKAEFSITSSSRGEATVFGVDGLEITVNKVLSVAQINAIVAIVEKDNG